MPEEQVAAGNEEDTTEAKLESVIHLMKALPPALSERVAESPFQRALLKENTPATERFRLRVIMRREQEAAIEAQRRLEIVHKTILPSDGRFGPGGIPYINQAIPPQGMPPGWGEGLSALVVKDSERRWTRAGSQGRSRQREGTIKVGASALGRLPSGEGAIVVALRGPRS